MPEPKEETPILPTSLPPLQKATTTTETSSNAPTLCGDTNKSESYENEFRMDNDTREYDSGNTATASSPEPEEYTYEGAIRGYVSRVSQNIPRRSLTINQETTREATNANINEDKSTSFPVVKVDVLKRREIFERASRNSVETRANNINNNSSASSRTSSDQNGLKSIKSRLSCLEKQKSETEKTEKEFKAAGNRLSGDMGSIRERLSHLEKETSERENKVANRKTSSEELDKLRSLCRERVVDEKSSKKEPPRVEDEETSSSSTSETRENDEIVTVLANINEKSGYSSKNDVEASTGNGKNALSPEDKFSAPAMSERSSSPDSEYREAPPRASFHRSLDSLDADASSGHDNFQRVQSLEELDYTTRYPASSSSTELLNDLTDREDSGIHTADVSCSVSQADEPVDEEVVHHPETIDERQEIVSEILDSRNIEDSIGSSRDHVVETENPQTTERQIDKTPITIEVSFRLCYSLLPSSPPSTTNPLSLVNFTSPRLSCVISALQILRRTYGTFEASIFPNHQQFIASENWSDFRDTLSRKHVLHTRRSRRPFGHMPSIWTSNFARQIFDNLFYHRSKRTMTLLLKFKAIVTVKNFPSRWPNSFFTCNDWQGSNNHEKARKVSSLDTRRQRKVVFNKLFRASSISKLKRNGTMKFVWIWYKLWKMSFERRAKDEPKIGQFILNHCNKIIIRIK